MHTDISVCECVMSTECWLLSIGIIMISISVACSMRAIRFQFIDFNSKFKLVIIQWSFQEKMLNITFKFLKSSDICCWQRTQFKLSMYIPFDIWQHHAVLESCQIYITDFKLHIYTHVFGSRVLKYKLYEFHFRISTKTDTKWVKWRRKSNQPMKLKKLAKFQSKKKILMKISLRIVRSLPNQWHQRN